MVEYVWGFGECIPFLSPPPSSVVHPSYGHFLTHMIMFHHSLNHLLVHPWFYRIPVLIQLYDVLPFTRLSFQPETNLIGLLTYFWVTLWVL